MSTEKLSLKVAEIVEHGFIATGISFGTRLGLFEALAKLSQSEETAVTTTQLAKELEYKERYVREWINGMVCADMLDHVVRDGVDRYWMAPHRVPALVGIEAPAFGAGLLTGCMADYRKVEKCFPEAGPLGTDVDDYPGLHEFLAERPSPWILHSNVKKLLADVQLVERLEKGINVLEIGCGAAIPTKAMANTFPNSQFVASELSEEILVKARECCKDLSNVSYEVLDACSIAADRLSQFDLVMLFDVFHDVPYPSLLLDGVRNLLTEGGQFLMVDLAMTGSVQKEKTQCAGGGALTYALSCLYCLPTSLKYPGGAGLGACAGPEVLGDLLRNSGLTNVVSNVGDLGLTFRAIKCSGEGMASKKRKSESSQ